MVGEVPGTSEVPGTLSLFVACAATSTMKEAFVQFSFGE